MLSRFLSSLQIPTTTTEVTGRCPPGPLARHHCFHRCCCLLSCDGRRPPAAHLSLSTVLPNNPFSLSGPLYSPPYHRHTIVVESSTASYWGALPLSFIHLCIRRRSAPMASSTEATEAPAVGNSESTSDVLVQYVVLRRDLIDTWPLGSVVTQGCHATVVAIKECDQMRSGAVIKCKPLFIRVKLKLTSASWKKSWLADTMYNASIDSVSPPLMNSQIYFDESVGCCYMILTFFY